MPQKSRVASPLRDSLPLRHTRPFFLFFSPPVCFSSAEEPSLHLTVSLTDLKNCPDSRLEVKPQRGGGGNLLKASEAYSSRLSAPVARCRDSSDLLRDEGAASRWMKSAGLSPFVDLLNLLVFPP